MVGGFMGVLVFLMFCLVALLPRLDQSGRPTMAVVIPCWLLGVRAKGWPVASCGSWIGAMSSMGKARKVRKDFGG